MVFKFKKTPKTEECECNITSDGLSDEDFASFCKTPEWIKRLPLGVLTDASGLELYIDGANQSWTRDQYKKRFGFDPKPVWERMRKQKIVKLGNSDRKGY